MKEQILRERARILAQETENQDYGEGYLEVVELIIAHEHYAIDSTYIREVVPLRYFTPIPCTPSFVLGLTNIRGEILSIIDIKKFFDLPEKGITNLNKIVILQNEDMEIAILADSILGVRLIDSQEIQPSLPTLSGIRAKYLKGITRDGLVILDAGEILSDKGIIVHEEVGI